MHAQFCQCTHTHLDSRHILDPWSHRPERVGPSGQTCSSQCCPPLERLLPHVGEPAGIEGEGGEHREGLWVCGSMGLGGARRRNDGPASRRVVALLFVCVKKQVHKSAPLLTKLTWPQGALRQDPLRTTPVGFEPTRGDPTGLAGRRLSRSAKVSVAVSFC